ncbi:hypothetical protein BBO99_00005105 [Phytophthora kernoviae]|uniref:Leucine zipper transcription factor-like protein 1 n=2 Tax=Phytophthora kernoviae TaxID=325452 RepID=A0A3R7GA31_9STRA|nr:hypothetical protein G195_008360 [Phytophthora kernoviae 00238/432]KAG2519400.1 hypothetical protein JM16_007160 [Phytophthora kernoviae]KAG2520537.1 hypothetical protein JM18_007049 [Phytophthora kernoviae]RLN44339.1 hypothetical protein BBI17_005208 [Phytophthora kernoviae]RLN79643.1 hypothetical protein BBO99_00005105 [Phytophthora kernoviae]
MGAGASTFIWRYADIQYGFLDQELGFDALHALAAQGRHRTVRSLLQKGMDPNARRLEGAFGADNDERGDSPMICTARGALGKKDRPQHVKTLEVLLHFGANINQANVMNHTPLYVACERNLLLVATWLLQHGADVNINCKTGTSPLMCAYENQNTALATLLLEKGAIVIRPAPTFSQIKFPELADELETIETPTTNKDHTALHSALQGYIDQEAERRSRLSADANEAQRLEDQRVYREQLAKEGAKRKARRRRQREEAQQQRRLPSVHAIGTATNSTESENDSNLLSSMLGGDHTNNGEGLLLWEKKAVVLRTRSLSKFLKFFRSRLKTHLENVEADFEDTRSDRLSSEEIYSQKDIKEAVTSLCFAVKANIRSELQDTINMMALLLRQIFLEAEDSDLALDLDIALVEDKELLEKVEQLSVSEWINGDSRGAAAIAALPRTNVKAQAGADAKAKLENQLQREQEQHEDEIRAAKLTSKQEQEALAAAHAKELRKLQRKLEQANERVEDLEKQVDDGRQHVAQTSQFQTMKRMVTAKNEQLRDLRHRLHRYEPDYAEDDGETKNADDDD